MECLIRLRVSEWIKSDEGSSRDKRDRERGYRGIESVRASFFRSDQEDFAVGGIPEGAGRQRGKAGEQRRKSKKMIR